MTCSTPCTVAPSRRPVTHWWRTALLATLLGSTLTACVPLVVGSAVGGTMLALDRRTSGAQLEDQGIELRGGNRINTAIENRGRVSVTSFNRIALLTGQVPTEADRQLAEATAKTLPNVRNVVNEITLGPAASFTQRSADSVTTGKVKTQLVGTQDVQANSIKVVTELGTVYLMGMVTAREADRATDVVRDVNGVLKVVKVFEIVSEDALSNTTRVSVPAATPATPAATDPATGSTTP